MWHRDQLVGEGLPSFAWNDLHLGQKFYHLDDKVILSASTFAHALHKVKVNPPVPRVNNISFLQIISIHNQVRLLNENLWNDHHRKNTLMCYQILSPNSFTLMYIYGDYSVENLFLDIYIQAFRVKGWQSYIYRVCSGSLILTGFHLTYLWVVVMHTNIEDGYAVYWGVINGTQMHYGRTVTANACFLSTWFFSPSPFKSQEQHTNSPYCSPYLSLKNY